MHETVNLCITVQQNTYVNSLYTVCVCSCMPNGATVAPTPPSWVARTPPPESEGRRMTRQTEPEVRGWAGHATQPRRPALRAITALVAPCRASKSTSLPGLPSVVPPLGARASREREESCLPRPVGGRLFSCRPRFPRTHGTVYNNGRRSKQKEACIQMLGRTHDPGRQRRTEKPRKVKQVFQTPVGERPPHGIQYLVDRTPAS